jgi:hypothetical protein
MTDARIKASVMVGHYKTYHTRDFIRKTEAGTLDLRRSIYAVRELAAAAGYHEDTDVVIDLREAETHWEFGQLITVALEFARYRDVFRNRIATIIPDVPERIANAQFFREHMGRQGLLFEYFTDCESAIEWLSVVKEYPDQPA